MASCIDLHTKSMNTFCVYRELRPLEANTLGLRTRRLCKEASLSEVDNVNLIVIHIWCLECKLAQSCDTAFSTLELRTTAPWLGARTRIDMSVLPSSRHPICSRDIEFTEYGDLCQNITG